MRLLGDLLRLRILGWNIGYTASVAGYRERHLHKDKGHIHVWSWMKLLEEELVKED